jgi:hypothetical protein
VSTCGERLRGLNPRSRAGAYPQFPEQPESHRPALQIHSRIQYKKICPVHGEVKNEDIVRQIR